MWTCSENILDVDLFRIYFGCGLAQGIFLMRTCSGNILDEDLLKIYFG